MLVRKPGRPLSGACPHKAGVPCTCSNLITAALPRKRKAPCRECKPSQSSEADVNTTATSPTDRRARKVAYRQQSITAASGQPGISTVPESTPNSSSSSISPELSAMGEGRPFVFSPYALQAPVQSPSQFEHPLEPLPQPGPAQYAFGANPMAYQPTNLNQPPFAPSNVCVPNGMQNQEMQNQEMQDRAMQNYAMYMYQAHNYAMYQAQNRVMQYPPPQSPSYLSLQECTQPQFPGPTYAPTNPFVYPALSATGPTNVPTSGPAPTAPASNLTNGFTTADLTLPATSPLANNPTSGPAPTAPASDLTNGFTTADLTLPATTSPAPTALANDPTSGLATTAPASDLTNGFTTADLTNGLTMADLTNGLTMADLALPATTALANDPTWPEEDPLFDPALLSPETDPFCEPVLGITEPLSPEEMEKILQEFTQGRSRASKLRDLRDLRDSCTCGPGCECVGCTTHPYNNATRQYVRDGWESQAAEADGDVESALTPAAHDPNQPPSSASAQPPLSDTASRPNDDGPEYQVSYASQDYMFVEYTADFLGCKGLSNSCPCGDDCACVGCMEHYNGDQPAQSSPPHTPVKPP
ncbi:hypothetical protein F4778DRAFT_760537 [Xylariomycetidae sp. FL2044]|nr:hypothetical protein F4778DRAFT_760537 [Xylariomycetidae sp. FL2044]